MAGSSLREITIPRFALRRSEAAASLGISPGHFDLWVAEKKMPEGHKVGRIVLWNAESVRSAWLAIIELETESRPDEGENPFDHMVV